ncbi:MAG: UvrD-helicase domain-containing protein, partial [Streptosporangiaceae bacterium]
MDQSRAPAYRLVRRPPPGGPGGAAGGAGAGAGAAGGAPRLDQAQQQVVDHAGGPLLVLAGPGTGKTTTIVA